MTYVWISRNPRQFQCLCARPALAWLGGPVRAVEKLFWTFKVVQGAVFAGWCLAHGQGSLAPASLKGPSVVAGPVLVVVGQVLNWSVFYRLGRAGVFYGDRFGYRIPWCGAFPFSVLRHPQYVGAVLTIWGLFVLMRFPEPDWYLLPALETTYYAMGTRWEG